MSTQQILGVVGGVVGAFFGYPQLGFVVGSLVGGLLTPGEKTEGPRVDDLKVQVSTYGAGIPILYGTERVGGNVVWSTDKIEIAETQGGKGGGPENTSYRYYVHMGIVLCETPRDGSTVNVVQIFQDGKLIYDARSGIPIGSALASSSNPYAYFVLYQGHADQLPDPGEEAWMGGPGSVPAYRGVVRIRMNAIECPGGRVPQFSFVLSTAAAHEATVETFCDVPSTSPGNQSIYAVIRQDEVWHVATIGNWYDDTFMARFYYCSVGSATLERTMHLPQASHVAGPLPLSGDGEAAFVYPYSGNLLRIDAASGGSTLVYTLDDSVPDTWHGSSGNRSAGYDQATGRYVLRAADGSQPNNIWIISDLGLRLGGVVPGVGGAVAIRGDTAYVLSQSADKLVISRYRSDDGVLIDSSTTGPTFTDESSSITFSALHPTDTGLYAWTRDVNPIGGGVSNNLWFISFASGSAAWQLVNDDVRTDVSEKSTGTPTTIYADNSCAIIGPSADSLGLNLHNYGFCRHAAIVMSDVKVSDIIADQCERAGETRYDVSGIPDTDTVHGYKLQNPASARSNVDPLLTAFAIYIVDEDGEIKFKKYEDITSEASIAYDELGQAEDGAEAADAMPLNRAQEVDLPRSVSVSYVEPAIDYQTASEKEVRQITESNEDMIIELPMATDSNHAKQVASMILFARWRAQNTRSFKTSRKYAYLSPGDGVTVEYPRGTWRLWRITSMTDTGALCEFNVEPGDAELYTQTAIGASGYVGQDVSPLAPRTKMLLLDSPIMRDADNNAGLYVAAEGFAAGWRGYTLWVGDDDTDLQERGTVTTSAAIGFAESALGPWAYNMLDGANSIVLNVGDDELNSTTEALLMSTRVNLALIGVDGRWEAIQFMTASNLGGGRYLVYGLLRGLFGTERFRNTHQANDTFVLMGVAGMLRPNQDGGSLGQSKQYRAVSLGRSRDSVLSQSFVNHGIGLLPYSPWDARKSKAANNDQTITWERRSRLTTNALRGTVPLGEAMESYSIEFYTGGSFATLAGTLTSTAKSLTITSAQQTAFGLVPGATLYVHIRQVSDVVGAGAPLEATL